MYGHMTYHVI